MNWSRALVRAGFVASVGLACFAGCSIVTSYDGFYGIATSCGNRIPDRPSPGTGGAGGALVGISTAINFLSPDDAAPYGFDLDNLCSCPEKLGCVNAHATESQCDLGNGVDNAAGKALNQLFPVGADGRLQASLDAGEFGMGVRVIGWDGSSNDADVQVSLYNVADLANGTFDVDDDSLLNPADLGSKYVDTSAYVTNGVLVASFDFDLRLIVPGADAAAPSTVRIPLTSAHLVGKIERSGASGLRIGNAQLIGRIPTTRIFTEISALGLCANQAGFDSIKSSVCATLDVPTNPAQDGTNVNCDALSFAMGIVIGPATLGGHKPVASTPNPCGTQPAVSCN